MTFGERLRKLRKQLDMTQEQISKNLNIVRSTYAYYETGKTFPDFDTVVRLAHLFNVTTDYLLDAEPTSPQLNDDSGISYTPSIKKIIVNDWSLRESEQKLLIAYRFLDKDTQQEFLNRIERAAADLYDRKRTRKKDKEPLN
ncbi:MAG: helix-turn-helix transcriptional regulator [Oscillospiraceae bacterium]|jgi:transcriptional regulator with XRE-family HTH domain|nr:helix-turn-helix transcriptional regulator [Oscillospiraceae bacterium]